MRTLPDPPIDELLAAAENIYDGWYAESNRIDWHDFIDRLEAHTGTDFGSSILSMKIDMIKRHIRQYRKL